MPSAAEILDVLTTIAGAWRVLAVLWHVYFAVIAASLWLGWRPANRLAGALSIPPLASVSALAWMEGSPFNGAVFAVLAVALVALLRSLRTSLVERPSPIWTTLGLLLFGFGWAYPHFLEGDSAVIYLYAAPLGVVPCPTLSVLVGLAIVLRGLGSRAWSLSLAAAALFYGVFGSLYLGVTIDWVLTAGGICLCLVSMKYAGRGSQQGHDGHDSTVVAKG